MVLLALLLFAPGCRENEAFMPDRQKDLGPNAMTYANIPFNEKGKMMEKFGKGIVEALKIPAFRGLLKTEALKQFNHDHDVLYNSIKYVAFSGGLYQLMLSPPCPTLRTSNAQNLHEFLIPFFESEEELNGYEARLPLLTILCPLYQRAPSRRKPGTLTTPTRYLM
jgi:hypothetical protein